MLWIFVSLLFAREKKIHQIKSNRQKVHLHLTSQLFFLPISSLPSIFIHLCLFVFMLHRNESTAYVFCNLSNFKYRCRVSKHAMVLKFKRLKLYTCLLQLQYIQCNMYFTNLKYRKMFLFHLTHFYAS